MSPITPDAQIAGLCIANAELGLLVLDMMGRLERLRAVVPAARAYLGAVGEHLRAEVESDMARLETREAEFLATISALQPGDLDGRPTCGTLRPESGETVAQAAADTLDTLDAMRRLEGRPFVPAGHWPGGNPTATLDAEPPEDLLEQSRPMSQCRHRRVKHTGGVKGECLDCGSPMRWGAVAPDPAGAVPVSIMRGELDAALALDREKLDLLGAIAGCPHLHVTPSATPNVSICCACGQDVPK